MSDPNGCHIKDFLPNNNRKKVVLWDFDSWKLNLHVHNKNPEKYKVVHEVFAHLTKVNASKNKSVTWIIPMDFVLDACAE